ncbi:MAG TPA: Mu-like prophage major head subunit gpT family protein [Noviherbaspirillum sp.]|nr:Mu-like prophage major head subunit gpT family protein [Noviherbaspirillum sp.]
MSTISTIRDEQDTTLRGMTEALIHRMSPASTLTDNGRRFRSMTLMEMAREVLWLNGVATRGMDRMQLASTALNYRSGAGMSTVSDFPSLMSNVANKRLRLAYTENPGTYRLWARRAEDAKNFKPISAVKVGAMPDLLQVKEHGEFQYGSVSDGAETYSLLTYGRMIALTRQAMVNDDLRAFDVAVSAFGAAAARLENRTVYAQLTGNAALSDGVSLFHADHSNLATGAGSALQLSALSAGRTAMRLQKGAQAEELNITPSFLIVPAALEQTAYQFTSANYVPALPGSVNEFRSGGRAALTPVVEPVLDGSSSTAWYLASNSSQIDTVEYCYLEGADGPVIESHMGISVDGMTLKCRLDFAAKSIDYRGLYKAEGV